MISKQEQQKVLAFAETYRKRAERVNSLKEDLENLQIQIKDEIEDMEKIRQEELGFLDELREKYDSTPQEIIQLIQKVVMESMPSK